jgi:glutathione S-transferase
MRLFHVPNSSSQRVLWLLEELGEPYELTILGDRASRLADPEHVSRHPLGRVPVLEDDGQYIFESGAICLFLADKFPQAGLLPPTGTVDRGLVYQWSFFTYTELQPRLIQVIRTGEAGDEAKQAAQEGLLEAARVVEQALDGGDSLVGGRFSVADVLVASALDPIRRRGLAELPESVDGYLAALAERPARRRADARNQEQAA